MDITWTIKTKELKMYELISILHEINRSSFEQGELCLFMMRQNGLSDLIFQIFAVKT